MRLPDRPLAAQAVDQPDALIGLERARLLGTIGKVQHHDKTAEPSAGLRKETAIASP